MKNLPKIILISGGVVSVLLVGGLFLNMKASNSVTYSSVKAIKTSQTAATEAAKKEAEEAQRTQEENQEKLESQNEQIIEALNNLDASDDLQAVVNAINELSNEQSIIIQMADGSTATVSMNDDTITLSGDEETTSWIQDSTDAVSEDYHIYYINSGDTLSSISSQEGVSVDKIASDNSLDDKNMIYAGSALRIYAN